MLNRRCLLQVLCTAAALSLPLAAQADNYPAKPVTLVVPYAPGGATDTLARILAEKLQARLGQPVLVDNRPGASTSIATQQVRQAPPDGYTLYVVASQFGVLPLVSPGIAKYHPVEDFTPIAQVTSMLMVLVASPSLPVKNVAELIALAKSRPGPLSMATTGVGSTDHLGGELLALRTGTKFNFVPYKGAAPAVQDVIAGVADLRLDAMPSSRGFIESGKLKALATFDARRHPGFPDIPAIGETVPNVEFGGYFGLVGPKGLPEAVVARLGKELGDVMRLPDVVTRLSALGLDPAAGTPAQFADAIRRDHDLWAQLIKDSGLKIEQ